MSTNQKYIEEYTALQKLEFYFGNKLNNFAKHEEPDFWNETDDIGLKITQSNFDGEQTKILQQIHGKNYTYEEAIEVLNKYDKKGKFKGQIGRITPTSDEFYSSPTKGMVNTNIYFDEIIKCINVKLDKLQHFKNFKEKFLCIIDHGHTIEKFDLKDYIDITKEAVHLIHNRAKSFRQIVNTIDAFEKVAQANGLMQIDENITQEILNG